MNQQPAGYYYGVDYGGGKTSYQPNPHPPPAFLPTHLPSPSVSASSSPSPTYGEDTPIRNSHSSIKGTETIFPRTRSFRDWPFALLFLLHLIGFFVIVGIELSYDESHTTASSPPSPPPSPPSSPSSPPSDGSSSNLTLTSPSSSPPSSDNTPPTSLSLKHLLLITILSTLVCTLFSLFWLHLTRTFARFLVYMTIVLSIFFSFTLALYFMVFHHAIGFGIFLVFLGVFQILWYWLVRRRISFAVRVLECVGRVMTLFRGMQLLAYLTLIPTLIYTILWIVTFRTLLLKTNGNDEEGTGTETGTGTGGEVDGITIVELLFMVFSLYWVTQVLKNVIHVTCAGVFSSWYFLQGTSSMPDSPTFASFKRATSYSFGSVCLGSLLIAIIQTIRAFFLLLRGGGNGSQNDALGICSSIIDFILMIIDSLVQYFNRYAFVQVAVYGKTFVQSARSTWQMFKLHGFEAVVNDDLTGMVITSGVIFSSLVGGILVACILPFLGVDPSNSIPLLMVGLVIGGVIAMTLLEIVDTGVATIFVCFVEHPYRLRQADFSFYTKFRDAYPECSMFLIQPELRERV